MKYINVIVSFLIGLGLPMGPQALLTVPGRKTGLPRTTPVALNPNRLGWRLISVYGRVDWVKNLQAAGSAVVTMRGDQIPVTAHELSAEQAALILRDSLVGVGPIVRFVVGRHFEAGPKDPLEAWRAEAARHPVFILTPA